MNNGRRRKDYKDNIKDNPVIKKERLRPSRLEISVDELAHKYLLTKWKLVFP